MKHLKWLILASLSLLIFGCGGKESETSTEGKDPAKKKIKLAFISNAVDDFWVYAEAGVRQAEAEFDDIEVQFRMGDGTTIKQRQIIDDMLVSGVKSVAFSPTNAKNQASRIDVWSKKIPIICVDSDSPNSKRISYLGTDNFDAGKQCGQLVKEALPNGGKIMVFVGLKDAQNAIDRFNGLKESLKGSNIEILDLRTDNKDAVKARKNAEDTLTKHPDIAGMVGLWAYNAPAILNALKAVNKEGKIKVISFDENPATLQAIDQGHIHGTVVQDPYTFGYESVKLMRRLVVEKKSAKEAGIPDNKMIMIPTKLIRKGQGLEYKKHCDGLKRKLKDNKSS